MNNQLDDREYELNRRNQVENEALADQDLDRTVEANPNRDPISGQTGAHPVGTGTGAAVAGTIGTAVGAIGGPVGGVIGAVVGSVIGGLIGKSTAEAFDPTVEDAYWQENYATRPYIQSGRSYNDYQPAYRLGYEGYNRYRDQGKNYDEVEPELRREYEDRYQDTPVDWENARYATRDAWDRLRYQSVYQDEGNYWTQNYQSEPYYENGRPYDDYAPAYGLGYDGYLMYKGSGKTYDEVEPDLRREYEQTYASSGLSWEKAKHAVQRAWRRAERAFQ